MAKKSKTGANQFDNSGMPIIHVDKQKVPDKKLTKLERQARLEGQSIRVASLGSGASFSGNYGGSFNSGILNADFSFYSPQLSTDFLELPQSIREKRELFKFFYRCAIPGTKILLADGTTKVIEDIVVGDIIPNGFGKLTRVKQIFKQYIEDEIYTIKVRGIQDFISVTGNHPFLSFQKDQVNCEYGSYFGACKSGNNALCERTNCHKKDFGKPSFLYAEQLKIGDFICSPRLKESVDCDLNYAQLRLLGYYAAEGSIRFRYGKNGKKPRGVDFSLNKDEEFTIAAEICSHFHNLYGSKAHIYRKGLRENALTVVCYNKQFAEFCIKYVGEGAHNKKLHINLMHALPEQQLEFIGAYWNGGGRLTNNTYMATSVSESLSNQLYQILKRLDFTPRLHCYDYTSKNYKMKSPTYHICFPGRNESTFKKFANFLNGHYTQGHYSQTYIITYDDFILRPIERIEVNSYKGYVHNFEVEGEDDEKSYVANDLSTHNTNPIVRAAIDFHTTIPMSKVRLTLPKGKDLKRNHQILDFFQKMCDRIKLFKALHDMTHEYFLVGECISFAEDQEVEIPKEILVDMHKEEIETLDYAGRPQKKIQILEEPKPPSEQIKAMKDYVAKHYEGFQRITILPPEQVRLETFQYTNKVKMELIPSDKDRTVLLKAKQGDPDAQSIADDIPQEIVEHLESGQPIPLNTSPYDNFLCSSFCYHLANKSAYDDRGTALLESCHLPGTEVTARRDGQILQIPIENLVPETDEVLGGSGQWRKFQTGSRPYAGTIIGINVDKLSGTVWSTPDHKMQVLRDDNLINVEAKDVKSGDFLKIASVIDTDKFEKFDLSQFFNEQDWVFVCRRTKTSLPVKIRPEESGDNLVLHYVFIDKNSQRESRKQKLKQICDWIRNLEAPVEISASAFMSKFDLSGQSVYRAIIRDLDDLGYATPYIKSQNLKYKPVVRLFRPASLNPDVLYEIHEQRSCPKWLNLDGDLGYLVGYYLGDGWTESSKPSATKYGPSGICWDQDYETSNQSIQYIIEIAKQLDLNFTNHDYKLGWLHFHDDWFSRWIGKNFGYNKNNKHLPDWIDKAPASFRFGILRGLIDSDGWYSSNKYDMHSVSISMTTKDLVEQLFIMAIGLQLSPNFSRRVKEKPVLQANGSYCQNPKPLYILNFSIKDNILQIQESGFSSKLNIDTAGISSSFSGSGMKSRKYLGNIYYQVKDIIADSYAGAVHSLDVDLDHTFYANKIMVSNCLRTLIYQDKLRQSQTMIASRAMTPKRVVWADKISEIDVLNLRDQIDQALIDPDFSIVANYEIHWDEIGSRDRLLDLSSEYEITNKLLFVGMRVTESMLTGESTYAGERIHLDVMNTMYLLYREMICEYVEKYLFAPVAEKKQFYEIDEWGNKVFLYPKLQFTRLALRDNNELFEILFNLYQKGSLPIKFILELLNIDSDDTLAQLKKDMLTPNDPVFNELIKGVLDNAASSLVEDTNLKERLAKELGLELKPKKEGDRFE
jgi:intein/homing endonuclease